MPVFVPEVVVPEHRTVVVQPVPVQSPVLPQAPERAVPTPDQFNDLPMDVQQKLMVQAVNDLENDLRQSDTGSAWIQHLQLSTITGILSNYTRRPLEDSERLRLQGIADVYDGVAQDQNFQSIAGLWGFNVLNVGLHVLATDPLVCQRHRVSSAANAFSQGIDNWSTAEKWRVYLRLPALMSMDDAPVDLNARVQEMEMLAAKFDRVQADPDFQMLRDQPAFPALHIALRKYANDLKTAAIVQAKGQPPVPMPIPGPMTDPAPLSIPKP